MVRRNLETGMFHVSQIYKQGEIGHLTDHGTIKSDPSEVESLVPWCEMNMDQIFYVAISAEIGEFYCRACARVCSDPAQLFHKFCKEKKYAIPQCDTREQLEAQISEPK